MNVLRKYARVPFTKKRTESVGTKLEKNLYDDWISLCKSLGLTSSEAVRLLILETLLADKKEVTNSNQEEKTIHNSNIEEKSITDSTKQEVSSTKKKKKSTTKRKINNLMPYEVDGRVPCPICKKFFGKKNYDRHCQRQHEVTSGYDLIQNHIEVVEQMMEEAERRGNTSGIFNTTTTNES